MITIVTDYSLKPRREKSHVFSLQTSGACGANEQVREDPGQPQHPDLEVAGSEFDWTSLLQGPNRHSDQPEDSVLRLVLRQKPVHQLDHMAGADGPVVILEKLHR